MIVLPVKLFIIKLTYPSCFKSNGELIPDPTSIATGFSKYFSNIGPNLAAKISPSTANYKDFLHQTTQPPLEFQPLVVDELKGIVHSFNSYKASGVDNIPMRVIKLSIDIIAEPLTEIINLSLANGCFPDTLKIAKVLPIFKTGDPEKLENYRPISILPSFSKLYEKVVYNRIYNYLTNYNLLYVNQFGFRRNHSTTMALIQLVNFIASAMDNREITAGVFLDLSKAFDTIDHQILLRKLEHYAIRGHSLDWIISYLTNRKQFVQYTSACSQSESIVCGPRPRC